MRPFDYHEPEHLDAALDLLGRYGGDATIMAGGTSLILLLKQGLLRPAHVVGLRRVADLDAMTRLPDGALRVGAMTTLREAERAAVVRAHCAALAEALGRVATVRIRNQATLGGNLAHADPASDPPTMLLALDAVVFARSARGERRLALDGFFTDVFTTTLAPDEVLVAVEVPPLPIDGRAAYAKFLPRTADDYATVAVAGCVATDADGRVTHARVALGASGPTPLRARRVEAALLKERPDPSRIAEIAALARDDVDPFDDLRGSAAYKREMARVWTARVLRGLLRA